MVIGKSQLVPEIRAVVPQLLRKGPGVGYGADRHDGPATERGQRHRRSGRPRVDSHGM